MADRTALILCGEEWQEASFDELRAGDLFSLRESDGTEVDGGRVAFAMTDVDPTPPGSVQSCDLGTMTRDQVLLMVRAIRAGSRAARYMMLEEANG